MYDNEESHKSSVSIYSKDGFIYFSNSTNVLKINNDNEIVWLFSEMLQNYVDSGITVDINLGKPEIKKIVSLLIRSNPLPDDEETFPLLCENFYGISVSGWNRFRKHIRKIYKKEKREKHIKAVTDINAYETKSFSDNIKTLSGYANSIPDAFILSLNNLGYADVGYIAHISGETVKNVITALKGIIFQNPETWDECVHKGWETAGEYLSGKIHSKLEAAIAANKKYNGYFAENVAALEKVIPPKLYSHQIYAALGSPWIPPVFIDNFIFEYFGEISIEQPTYYDDFTGLWHIPYKRRYIGNITAETLYGTKRMNAVAIIEHTLNKTQINVYDEMSDCSPKGKKRVINTLETAIAAEKQIKISSEFENWLWRDAERKKLLEQIYNDKFAMVLPQRFDGSFLNFPGMNKHFQLYDYQKNAVARIMMSKNTLLAYEVGTGKTFIMIAAGMEMRRIGISSKNMYVVPNSIIGQWEDMFKALYPNSNILVVDPRSFAPKNRRSILMQIKNDDYDGIIIAYSCFGMIKMSPTYEEKQLNIKIEQIEASNTNRRTDLIKEEIYRLRRKRMFEDEIYFDELGINTLFVDEAHNFKNVPIKTHISNVLGISSSGSEKCAAMMKKVKFVQKQNSGRGIVFATGTPITNSLTDIYIMQKYLQSDELRELGIERFDEWVGMFAEKSSELEVDVCGTGFRTVTRFSKFHNLPELASIFGTVADFFHVENRNNIPKFNGYHDVVIQRTDKFSQYMSQLEQRADAIRSGFMPKCDNMLKITTDGRKAALDIRLVNVTVDPEDVTESFKVYSCARHVFGLYMHTAADRLTQVVFCDWSVPKRNDGFNIYFELKALLVKMGVKPDEIVFVHDTSDENREKIFEAVRSGKIRIIIGSTAKLGTGVNIQDRLIALHHLDVPWRPADIIQREGRILRAGNINKKVKIYRYIAEGSFDSYSWQILETKQKIITEILGGKLGRRDCDDIDSTVLNYAEAKALAAGNKYLKQRIEKSNELSRYILLQKQLLQTRQQLESTLNSLPGLIEYQKQLVERCSADIICYHQKRRKYLPEERAKIRKFIKDGITGNEYQTQDKAICKYQGFQIVIPYPQSEEQLSIFIENEGKYRITLGKEGGYIQKIDNFLNKLENYKQSLIKEQAKLEPKLSAAASALNNVKSYSEQIQSLKQELIKLDKHLR